MNISFNIYFIYGYEDIIFSYLFSAKNNWNVDVQTELLLPARPKKSVTHLTVVTTYLFAVHKRLKSWEDDKFPYAMDIWPERCQWLEHEPYAVRQMNIIGA